MGFLCKDGATSGKLATQIRAIIRRHGVNRKTSCNSGTQTSKDTMHGTPNKRMNLRGDALREHASRTLRAEGAQI